MIGIAGDHDKISSNGTLCGNDAGFVAMFDSQHRGVRRNCCAQGYGRARLADDILKTMRAAGYDVRENDPFRDQPALALPAREQSPYVNRVRLMWQEMRKTVMEMFPATPGPVANVNTYMKAVEDIYVTDAYHSLSIEGYRVSPDLIERVRAL